MKAIVIHVLQGFVGEGCFDKERLADMRRLFVGNFSFEEQRRMRQRPNAVVRQLEAELACVWLSVAATGDAILCPESIPAEYWSRMSEAGCPAVDPVRPSDLPRLGDIDEIVPWGWSPSIRALAEQTGNHVSIPEQSSIWGVNSRRFSFELEASLNVLPTGARLVESLDDLQDVLRCERSLNQGWILKANFGQSGRGQQRGKGAVLSPTAVNWARGQLDDEGVLVIEPCLSSIEEVSGQWELAPSEEPRLIGVTQLLSDSRGQYRGTFVTEEISRRPEIADLIAVQRKAAERVRAAGYFGPLGIDAMLHRDVSGRVLVRPLQDVNARWTMGRLAIAWSHRLSWTVGTSTGTWLHSRHPPSTPALALSPESVGGRPTRYRTWWISDSARTSDAR